MDILVMNLTRLGDLLQSQPAIAGLAAQGHGIHLACLENFAPAAELMQGLQSVRPFPGARILARLDQGWRQGLAAHREAVETLTAGGKPDVVINLTPSQPARLLARSLAGDGGTANVRGFVLDEFGFNADSSAWAAFLQLASRSRGASPFNIVDLFRRISGLSGVPQAFALRGPSEDEQTAAKARIFELCPQAAQARGLVALQLGASEERRRWPVARFADVATRLAARGFVPVLVGTAQERQLGQRLKERAGVPMVDLMGATGLRELAATLSCCDLLLTNDTGTMHLAAGLGLRCLAIFLATAQPWDTGPYLPGCLCLEPDLNCHPCAFGKPCRNCGDGEGEGHEACRWAISAPGVAALALDMLEGRQPRPAPDLGARVWQSTLGEDGLMDLACLSLHEEEDRTRLIRAQRALYRRYLDGEAVEQACAPARPLGPEAAQALGKALGEATDLLFLLLRQGELLARDPLPTAKAKFLATWQRVQSALGAEPRLGVLAELWVYESERPGLELAGILALVQRFRALALALRASIAPGT